ncbi:hypothetical protein Y032_0103g3580 [Ancylostoma ceylanicum]|uniref:Uncharacterized protein n=1 Tax=Ancylostoma ceylanicum TaxID=53326 RepID=A0A016TH58_9BILA|nr:hypothetical protein Y032_0103g3580 [Ancylostoma ceylanicum]
MLCIPVYPIKKKLTGHTADFRPLDIIFPPYIPIAVIFTSCKPGSRLSGRILAEMGKTSYPKFFENRCQIMHST